jgi:hypothetical protein
MKIMRTCRDVTRLVLEGDDRALTPWERISLRMHWMICQGCTNFRTQHQTLRTATDRWRQYRDGA